MAIVRPKVRRPGRKTTGVASRVGSSGTRIAVVGAIVAVALLAGSTVGSAGTSTSAASRAAAGTHSVASALQTSANAPKAGGKVTIGTLTPIRNFDPYTLALVNFPIYRTLYSYLIVYTASLKPRPDVATSWRISADHKSVVLQLRNTVFGDGSPLTAADVVAGVRRAQDKELGGNMVGPTDIVAGAQALDPHTVRIDFKNVTSEDTMLDWLKGFPVVESSKNNPEYLTKNAAGSGPFLLKSYTPGSSVTLKRNPNYYGVPKPYLDEVEFRFFNDADALVAALRAGSVDGALSLDTHYQRQLENDFLLMRSRATGYVNMLMLNPKVAPFNVAGCRQAVSRAIDREAIMKVVQNGVGVPVVGPFSPTSPAFDRTLLRTHGFDLKAAAAGIKKFCKSKSASAIVQPTPFALPTLELIQANLAKAGFKLSLETMDAATWLTRFLDAKYQVAVNATTGAWRSPSALTRSSVMSNGLAPASFVAAIRASQRAQTPAADKSATQRINKILTNGAWAIGINTRVELYAFNKNISGFVLSAENHPILTNTYRG